MTDKPDDNIELIFRTAMEPIEVEPSDHFWNSSYEGIIQRTDKSYAKRVNRWRVIAVALTATILVLLYSHYEMNDKVNSLEKRVETVEKANNSASQNIVSNNNSVNVIPANKRAIAPSSGSNMTSAADNKVVNVVSQSNTEPIVVARSSQQNVIAGQNNKNENNSKIINSSNGNSVSGQSNNNTPSVVNFSANTSNDINSNNQIVVQSSKDGSNTGSIQHAAIKDSVSSPTITLTHPAIAKVDTLSPAKSNIPDTTSAPTGFINPPVVSTSPKSSILSKMYVSAFFAPHVVTGNTFKDNNSSDNVTVNTVKNNDNDYFGYTVGLRIGYDISPSLSVFTGCSYNGSSFSIKPSVVYASQQENGQVGFPIVTSSGVVTFNYTGPQPKVGDSIKVHGTSYRNYMSIPLGLKYEFYRTMKFDLYATLGGAMEIISYKGTDIHWQNTMFQEGDVSVSNIQGLRTTHFSYLIGVGARYHLFKGLSVFAEPYFQSSVDAINSNTPVSTYAMFLGITGGLNYHF